jgi:hypothetical protein
MALYLAAAAASVEAPAESVAAAAESVAAAVASREGSMMDECLLRVLER